MTESKCSVVVSGWWWRSKGNISIYIYIYIYILALIAACSVYTARVVVEIAAV